MKSSLVVILVSVYVSLLLVLVPPAAGSGAPLFCDDAAACSEPAEQQAMEPHLKGRRPATAAAPRD